MKSLKRAVRSADRLVRLLLAFVLLTLPMQFASPEPAEASLRPRMAPRTLAMGVSHAHEIRSDGTLWAWGSSGFALGLGPDISSASVPMQVGDDRDWVSVAAGSSRSFAIKADGTLWAWGLNTNYELGLGDTDTRYVPTLVNAETDWVAVDSQGSDGSTFALKGDGTLWAWGYNADGRLGLGDTESHPTPAQVPGHTGWVAFEVGGAHIVALKADGTVWTWGRNTNGELGLGYTSAPVGVPTQVSGLQDCVSVSAGWWHSAAIAADGTLMAWGHNGSGRLGDGTTDQRTAPVEIGTGWRAVSGGADFTVGIKADGTMWGWGENGSGQVGDGTFIDRLTPTPTNTGTDWVAVCAATGYYRSSAVRADGSLHAWGTNGDGALGTGNTAAVNEPTPIGATFGWSDIAEGHSHAIAIREDGTMWAAGLNRYGRLGLGIDDEWTVVPTYTQVGTDTDWTAVVVDEYHNLALKSDGTLWAWGTDEYGQLGVELEGAATNSTVPVQVGTDDDWSDIGVGHWASYAIKESGELWSWGWNGYGQLGLDSVENVVYSPQMVDSDVPWVAVEGDHSYAMGVKADGTLWGWGWYSGGRIGISDIWENPRAPMQVGEDADWVTLSCGYDHSLALKADGTLWGWGSNVGGQLGLGDTGMTAFWTPTRLLTDEWTVEHWRAVSAGEGFSHAIALDGTLWAWGDNYYSRLGDGTDERRWVPTRIGQADTWSAVTAGDYGGRALRHDGSMWAWGYDEGGARRFGDGSGAYTQYYAPKMIFRGVRAAGQQPVGVAAGYTHALMLKGDGALWGWGANQYGQLGGSGTRLSPAPVDAAHDWADVSAGLDFTLALKADGTLWSWGYNNQGQLGQGDYTARSAPTQIGTDDDWVEVAAGTWSSFALKADGTLWSWGLNTEGQLGHGDNEPLRPTPTQVGTETDWAEILDAASHTFARKSDGTLWAWGDNFLGRLGLGDEDNRNAPEQVGVFDDWVVASAAGHSLGVRADGTLWAWGRGNNSQLGLGDTENRLVPTQVAGTGWADAAAGSLHSLALKADGTLWAWGSNGYGELGVGDTTSRSLPVRVGSGTNWTGISTAGASSYAIDASGLVHSWGRNDTGQLGLGDTGVYRVPTLASAAGDVTVPLVLGVRSSTHPLAGVAYPLDTFTASVDVYDTGSHIVGYSWVVDQLPDTVPDEDVDTSGAETLIVAEDLAPGVWYLHVRAIDAGANASATFTRAVRVSEPVVVNAPPIAVADAYETDEDVALVVADPGVLGNDTDADGDDLTADKVSGPAHGAVTLDANGGFTYTPAAGYFGTDSFTYKANDGQADSNVVTVTITVNEAEEPDPEPLPPVIPIAGPDRFSTAVEASLEAYPNGLDPAGAQTVVIATGRNWPDALGGSALAGALDGPLLLTEPGALPTVITDEIGRLGAEKAIILGGEAAVSPAVAAALAKTLDVERIAGNDRYQTADKVASRVISTLGGAYDGTAFVGTGGNFPDALGASPLAAANGWPLFLAHPTAGLSAGTKAAMAGVDEVLILGGRMVVSDATASYLIGRFGAGSVTRLAGADRYETAAKVAAHGVDHGGLIWNRVAIATGQNFPDALAGGVLQGKVGSVMLLTRPTALDPYTRAALVANKAGITTVTFFGGTGALPQAVRDAVLDALE